MFCLRYEYNHVEMIVSEDIRKLSAYDEHERHLLAEHGFSYSEMVSLSKNGLGAPNSWHWLPRYIFVFVVVYALSFGIFFGQ